jgi:uncharacterized protein (DUF2267 family)
MTYDHFIGSGATSSQAPLIRRRSPRYRSRASNARSTLDQHEAKHLAAQLPKSLQCYLDPGEFRVRMSLDDYFQRICDREKVDLPDAVCHVRVVIEVLQEAVSAGEIADVLAELPPDWAPLFGGSRGHMKSVVV